MQLNKTALITGAAGGIGRALVQIFRDDGYHVIATDCIPQPADFSCDHYVQADLAHFAEKETYAQAFLANLRGALNGADLNALINNAATQILGSVDSLTREDWQQTFNVNLLAPFLLIQALLPELQAAKGCVVNISSIHARLTKKNFVAYATSKAALSGMTRALALDLGDRIRINAIEPAAIGTDMLKTGFEDKQGRLETLEKYHPYGRIGLPEEVARLALTMVKDGMEFMHGACVPIDGGIGARLYDPD